MRRNQTLEGTRDRLRRAFIASGKTAVQVCRETGIPKSSFYRHLNGEGMSLLHLARYCTTLKVSADYLLGLKKEATP